MPQYADIRGVVVAKQRLAMPLPSNRAPYQ